LLDAFVNRRVAVIRYQDQHATVTEREIELQYLYYNLPVWYALVWDRLRDNVRFFRIDRIKRIQLLREQFRLRRDDQFLTAGEPDAKAL
jgi:predicted DNA-binding transcriptional regulator YafY